MKNSIDFCFVRFYVSFSLYTSSLSNSYLTTWLTLSQISLYIHQRDMYLISSKFLQYVTPGSPSVIISLKNYFFIFL